MTWLTVASLPSGIAMSEEIPFDISAVRASEPRPEEPSRITVDNTSALEAKAVKASLQSADAGTLVAVIPI